ncbi:uncharacterized protein VTP21DRAFT_11436 [Calcarisporiella thermophila]|uniref:uncharacterized protein n=1 Tax=Calcarisporiella thermophila TaxID=911321 RepID=UPI00374341A7
MADTLKTVPEFFETTLGESLASRTEILANFHELGPPDLCHITKINSRPPVKEVGSYHYVYGVDASSSASLAAYLNSLTYAVDEPASWFAKSTGWRIRSGVYCCFNAFSRVDVRVEVKIPGGVESYYIDLRGERHPTTPDIWQETYMSALLRSFLYSDDRQHRTQGLRKLDPIQNIDQENRFLEAASELFFQAEKVGSEPEIHVATPVNNYLVAGIFKYFGDAFRLDKAVKVFEKAMETDPEIAALLAQAYLRTDEEVKAIHVAHKALKMIPSSYPLLHFQADFLRDKGQLDLALKLAKRAVDCAPSEFVTWAKLTEVYIDMGQYDSALLTLNSCPMFTFNDRDFHRMPPTSKTSFPVKQDIYATGILEEDSVRNDADATLLRLPAPSLRGTFAKAYSILTRLVDKVGWDELLKYRSTVFVMEEEYRAQREAAHEEWKASLEKEVDAGKKLMVEKPSIPTIKISTESDREREQQSHTDAPQEARTEARQNGEAKENARAQPEENDGAKESNGKEKETEPAERGEGGAINEAEASPAESRDRNKEEATRKENEAATQKTHSNGMSLANKRLCERWLDNLFMVLYEDLRVFTVWRAEMNHYKAQHVTYRKTGSEWEILGDLALRLHHKSEAKEAFQRCLEHKFSSSAWSKLLELYAEEGDTLRALQAVVKLAVFNDRWYDEMVYPTLIGKSLNQLVRRHGLSKVQNVLISMNVPPYAFKLVTRFLNYVETFRVEGWDM